MSGRPFTEFSEISPETQSVLKSQGFLRATPVQEATIPLFCGNKDVAVDACTGSGKTLAFIIPVVERLRRLSSPLKRHQVGAVVISPTRELSRQIFSVGEPFFQTIPWLTARLLVGGSDPAADVADLRSQGGHILVGTPGRLDDLLQRCPFLDLKSVEVLVLDEADRLLDMGFKAQVDAIIQRLPRQRRTGLFSATQTEAVQALARAGLRNPVRVNVAVTMNVSDEQKKQQVADTKMKQKKKKGEDSSSDIEDDMTNNDDVAPGYVQVTPSTLSVQYTVVATKEKLRQLVAFIQAHKDEKVIVYFLTCACVDYFSLVLPILWPALHQNSSKNKNKPSTAANSLNPSLLALHGRMKQAAREATLSSFASCEAGVLLCTDVAARGLDIPDVHWVVQYDAPQDPSAFVHRCGRTARMGRTGHALVYLTQEESAYVDFLKVRKVPLAEVPPLPTPSPTQTLLDTLRKASETDRTILESGIKAFVSYIRAYKEHHCRFIFRPDDLALGALASSFALLRMPGMPEVKRAIRISKNAATTTTNGVGGLDDFVPSEIDPDTVKFKDKAREKQRQSMLKQKQESKQESKHKRKEDARKEKAQKQQQLTQQQRLTASKRRQLEARQEFDDLNDEYALLRKLKKGKISQKEYDVAAGLSDDSDFELDTAVKTKKNTTDNNVNDIDQHTDGGDSDVQAKQQNGKGSSKGHQNRGDALKGVTGLQSRDYIGTALLKKAKKKKKKNRKQKTVGNTAD